MRGEVKMSPIRAKNRGGQMKANLLVLRGSE